MLAGGKGGKTAVGENTEPEAPKLPGTKNFCLSAVHIRLEDWRVVIENCRLFLFMSYSL